MEILTALMNMSSNVPIAVEAANKALKRLKTKAPTLFQDPILLFEIFLLLERFTFSLKHRRLILELFDGTRFTEEALGDIEATFPVK